jgi:hypothetical protein
LVAGGRACGAATLCASCTTTNGRCSVNGDCCSFQSGTGYCVSGYCADSCTLNSQCVSQCCAPLVSGGSSCAPRSNCP